MLLLMYRGSRIKPSHNVRIFISVALLGVFPNFPLDITGEDKVGQKY